MREHHKDIDFIFILFDFGVDCMFRFISIFIYSKNYFYNSIIGPKPI